MWLFANPSLPCKQSVVSCPGHVFPNDVCKKSTILSSFLINSNWSREATFTSVHHRVLQSWITWRPYNFPSTLVIRVPTWPAFQIISLRTVWCVQHSTQLLWLPGLRQDGHLGHHFLPNIWVPGTWKQWHKWKIHTAISWALLTQLHTFWEISDPGAPAFSSLCFTPLPSKPGSSSGRCGI